MFQQFYLTHCTYATSALERRRDEMAAHPLGYSVRSGSLKGNQLRNAFRRMERYVYYYLPMNTPAQEKEYATAHTAPARLFYLPAADGNRMMGQIVYREKDTAGRTGSYFGHVLLAPRKSIENETNQEILEILQMWGVGGWETQDGEHLPHELLPITSLTDLTGQTKPLLDDALLVSFLTSEQESTFHDPENIIPGRWKKMSLRRRQILFKNALVGLLSVLEKQGTSLILYTEPVMAALIFYGLIRFLPKKMTKDISFSTYEPQMDLVFTKMAATTLYMPEENDLRDEIYQGTQFVINTFSGRLSVQAEKKYAVREEEEGVKCLEMPYVQRVFKQFLEEGISGVLRYCAHLDSVGAVTVTDANALVEVERIANQILPASTHELEAKEVENAKELPFSYAELEISASRMATNYLCRRMTERLAVMENPEEILAPLVGTARHSLLAELLGAGSDVGNVRAGVQFLLVNLQESQFSLWLRNSRVSDDLRARVLERWIHLKGVLPKDCEFLWQQAVNFLCETSPEKVASSGDAEQASPGVMAILLPHMKEQDLERFYENMEKTFLPEFFVAFFVGLSRVMDRLGATDATVITVRTRMDKMLRNVSSEVLLTIHQKCGGWFLKNYPGNIEVLGEVLGKLVPQLLSKVDEPEAFLGTYRLLLDAQECLVPEYGKRMQKWKSLLEAVSSVVSLQPEPKLGKKCPNLKELEKSCREMAFLGLEVLDESEIYAKIKEEQELKKQEGKGNVPPSIKKVQKEWTLSEKRQIAEEQIKLLRKIAVIRGGNILLPADAWQNVQLMKKVAACFLTRTWSVKKLSRFAGKDRSAQRILILMGGTCLALLAVLLWVLLSKDISDKNTRPGMEDSKIMADSGTQEKENQLLKDEGVKSPREVKRTEKETERKKGRHEEISVEPKTEIAEVSDEEILQNGQKNSSVVDAEERNSEISEEDEFSDFEKFRQMRGEETESDIFEENPSRQIRREEVKDTQVSKVKQELRPTPNEVLQKWDEGLLREAKRKLGIYCEVPLHEDKKHELPRSESQRDVRTQVKLQGEDMISLQMQAGYLIFEGRAFPFGEITEGDLKDVFVKSGISPSKKKKPGNVLMEEELEENLYGIVQVKNPEQATVNIPGVRYELPELGKLLDLSAVVVKMDSREDGTVYFVVEGIRKSVSKTDIQKQQQRRETVERLRGELNLLGEHIKNYETALKEKSSVSQREKMIHEMAKILQKDDVTDQIMDARHSAPQRMDFKNQKEYETAVESYRRKMESRTRLLLDIPVRAKDEYSRRAAELQAVETQIDRVTGQITPEEQQVLERLSKNSSKIKVVLWRPGGFSLGTALGGSPFRMYDQSQGRDYPGDKKPAAKNATGEIPREDFQEDGILEDPFGTQISEETKIHVIPEKKEEKEIPRLAADFGSAPQISVSRSPQNISTIFIEVEAAKNFRKLGAVLKDYNISCECFERLKNSSENSFVIKNIFQMNKKDPHPLLPECKELALRLVFFQKNEENPDGEGSNVPKFYTHWFYVGPIQENKNYSLRVKIGRESLQLLHNPREIIIPDTL
ncbi:MAG: hypothetical protein Q4C96_04860 [Planctomycetia bacterium]|nr:hypothetical protein [Planctomycetia bacterium]